MIDNVVPTFSNYGKQFQEKLAFLILEDRVFADRMQEVLDVEFFETKYLQGFVSRVFDYKIKFKTHPARSTMEVLLRTSLEKENEILQKQMRDYYARMVSYNVIDDGEFVKSESLDFCRKQKLHEAMMKSASLIKSNSFDEISKIINNALKAGSEIDPGHDYLKDFEKRYVENVRNPIPTGWDKIDELTSGGLGRGEYGLIMAPTGAGKSMLLIHLGTNAIKKGLNVVFYTLELSAAVIGLRFDACLSGVPVDELKNNKDKLLDIVTNVPGKLIIKQYPKKSVSMMTIKTHLARLKSQGFTPDMIVLDYLDLLKASSVKKELRFEVGETYDEFEAVCQEDNIVGWTASQTNRTGFNVDVVQMEQTSEAINKNFGSYLTLGLARTGEDKNKNTGRLSICKNRSGPDGMAFNIFMDPANVDIKILEEYDPRASRKSLVNANEEKRRMREKYNKFKTNGGSDNNDNGTSK